MSDRSPILRGRDPVSIGRAAVFAALVAVVLERLTAIANDMQLWGDGAWFLVRIASTRNYYFWIADFRTDFFRSRLFTNLLVQTPLVLATHLRIFHLHVLSIIFGITCYSYALISLYICYRYATKRWYVLFPLLSFVAGTMNVESYIITDSHLLVSLYWPVLLILLFSDELTNGTLALLLALSIPTVLSYESMLFFGVVLAGVCAWRWRKHPRHRRLVAGLAAWYLLGAVMAVASVLWPFDPSNKAGFLRGFISLYGTNHLAAKISTIVLLCCAGLLAIPSRLRSLGTALTGMGLLSVGYLFWQVFVGRVPTSLNDQIPARVLNLVIPLAVTALLLPVVFGWLHPDRRAIGLVAILVGALGIGQAFWSFACIGRWQGVLATLRYELTLRDGPIAFEDSILSQRLGPLNLVDLHATWPLLPLSLYESENGQVKSVIVPQARLYLPFDPFVAASFPDLSRYGVKYGLYREALDRTWRYDLDETLTFSKRGNAAPFMRGGWGAEEDWATWSTEPDFELILPLRDPAAITGDVILQAEVAPNLSPADPRMTVDVLVNDVTVGQWSFQYLPEFTPRTVEVRIPRNVLLRTYPAHVHFHIREPLKSPAELGKGWDPRKLGLAFVKLRLSPEQ